MKKEIVEKVTEQIIKQLEAGVVPWHKPWSVAGLMPTNGVSNKPYRGINTMLLAVTQDTYGYKSPYWYTFNQAKKLGGNVKRGEKGYPVIFWKVIEKATLEMTQEDERDVFVLARTYTVFNADQTENFEPREMPYVEVEPPKAVLQKVLKNYKNAPQVRHDVQTRAYYNWLTDEVCLPPFSAFESQDAHLSTLFHELVHSTGHSTRLNRNMSQGQEEYAQEELVAEIGAAMMLGMTNSESQFEQSASYVHSWLQALKNDRSLIIKAAQKAQKAVDYINGTTAEDETA